VGVIGGCFEYTGAPFYAAVSALKLGADLSHVFCDAQAATPIKGYSPELIVHGCLQGDDHPDAPTPQAQADAIIKWFPALTVLVVGPGLGRDARLQEVAGLVIERAVADGIPCVIDADGLRVVMDQPHIIRGSKWVVLTPNVPEFRRLLAAVLPEEEEATTDSEAQVGRVSAALGGVLVVRKGAVDVVTDGESVLCVAEEGSPKRSGGQGDVLAGCLATLLSWAQDGGAERLPAGEGSSPAVLATYAACYFNRKASAEAFRRHRRAMTAPDVVDAIGPTFDALFPIEQQE
jgi:ATP-dependent NAD(P)H-hydrate dehydratase